MLECELVSPTGPKLSICIPTRNRASFIGATLESIITQWSPDCEIVVVDGASHDETENVVAAWANRCGRLRYVKREVSEGFDRDLDQAVELASGEYCWLMSDDDFIRSGAVARVLEVVAQNYSLIVGNAEIRDVYMSATTQENFLEIVSDRVFNETELDQLFDQCGLKLCYMGCVIIRRDVWMGRSRHRYFGSYFVHLAVIFQEPLPGSTLLMSSRLVSVRGGNQSWLAKHFELEMIILPGLVWSFPLSEAVQRRASSARPWARFGLLLRGRGDGLYSLPIYFESFRPRHWSRLQIIGHVLIAGLPMPIAYVLSLLHHLLTRIYTSTRNRLSRFVGAHFLNSLAVPKRDKRNIQ